MTMTNTIYANATVSITDLRRSPSVVIEEAGNASVAILNHNRATAYRVPANVFEALMETIEDIDMEEIVRSRRGGKTQKVSLDEL